MAIRLQRDRAGAATEKQFRAVGGKNVGRRWRRLAVAALVIGPGLNLTEALIPRTAGLNAADLGPSAALVESVAQHPTLLLWARIVGLLGAFLLLPAFLAAFHLLRDRAPTAAKVGRRLVLVGTMGFVGLQVFEMVRHVAAGTGPDSVVVMDALMEHPALILMVLVPFLVGMFGALFALAVGTWRARVVPRIVPVLLVAFAVLDLSVEGVGLLEPHWPFFLAMVIVAVRVLQTTDDDWNRGFQAPALGG